MTGRVLSLVLAPLLLAGCPSTSPDGGFRDMAQTIEARSGHQVQWNQAGAEDKQVDDAVGRLLAHDLSVNSAVQIALLNNKTLLATYEELSLVQADVVQAGLLKNPVFAASITTGERDALDPNLIFGVTQDFLDILMLPARKKIAAAQFEQTKLRVADAVLVLASDVRNAYYTLQGAQQILAMRKLVGEAAAASAELVTRQHEAGNVSDLVLASEQALYEQIQLDVARSEAEVLADRERLTRLMGVWGMGTTWKIASLLPELPKEEVPLQHLESLAVAQRLDLDAARKEVQTLSYALSLSKSTRWTGAVGVGADVARLKNGQTVIGPNAAIELPLFDQRQAVIARLEAFGRAAEDRLQARAIDVRSEVRLARERVLFSRRILERYRSRLIPLRERIVALSQQEYDAMLLGVYQLLAAKQGEVNAYREYIEAARDYWLARSDLERAVGGRITQPGSAADVSTAPAVKLPGPTPDTQPPRTSTSTEGP